MISLLIHTTHVAPSIIGCGHMFCMACLYTWFEKQQQYCYTCPLCRGTVDSPPLALRAFGELSSSLTHFRHFLGIESIHDMAELEEAQPGASEMDMQSLFR